MEIDPAEIQRRYDELSDEGLLSIDREDLTALAQSYYDAELQRRGLSAARGSEQAIAPAGASGKPGEPLVLVATFLALHEADMALTLLRSAEIPVYLENELTSMYTGSGGLRLMVPESYVAQAEEVLDAPISEEELAAQAEAAGSDESSDDQVE